MSSRNARRWTDPTVDERWLETKIPAYQQLMCGAKSGGKNSEKCAFILEVLTDYEAAFPGRIDNMKFKGIGVDSTEQEKKSAIFNVSTV